MEKNKSKQVSSTSLGKLIEFHSIDTLFTLTQKNQIRKWLSEAIKKEKHQLSFLSFNFCSDGELLRINREYLNHDYYTDIITFDLSDQKSLIEGDIYISIDRVRENARTNHSTFHVELKRVLIHGVLHLCGYKDKKKSESELMRKKEDFYLSLLD